MSEENDRIWGAGVGGWGARKRRKLNYREKFWVDGRNQIWKNCTALQTDGQTEDMTMPIADHTV